MREKAKGTVPCSDVRFRLTGRTNSGRSREAGVVPGAWTSHPGDSKSRDPESAASTSGRAASAASLPMLGKAVQQRFVVCGWYRGRGDDAPQGAAAPHEEESRDG